MKPVSSTKKLLDERNAARAELQWIIHYFGHYDQDANHAWMVRRIRAVLDGKPAEQVEGWRTEDGVRKPRVCDSCKTREPANACEDCIVRDYEATQNAIALSGQTPSEADLQMAERWIISELGVHSEGDAQRLSELLSLVRKQEAEKHADASQQAAQLLPPPKPKTLTTACAGCGAIFQYEK